MVLVIRADGRYWDGFGWNIQGKEFLSVVSAIRSLHESGEDLEEVQILDLIENTENDSTTDLPSRLPQAC